MYRVSTNLTLFLKFFVPVVWIVFFASFTIAVWVTDEHIGPLGFWQFKIGLTIFLFLGALVLYFLFMRLKRVEMSGEHIYISNYIKTYRYPYDSIAEIKEDDFLLFRRIRVFLKEAGKFGRKIVFVADKRNLRQFYEDHPAIKKAINSI